jgi:hypothetical protein
MGGVGAHFFVKNRSTQKFLKHIYIDPVFHADSEYDIRFDRNHSFVNNKLPLSSQNHLPAPLNDEIYQEKVTRRYW